ncbi:Alpha/Beta hydrolase protein [Blyttiomyces helicus]|uniref:Alpha/Beta hydrolase protein n=1 Tax=Blyttiomyces helicus TaxID=388810 RepID=A0A4P9WII8_9FUNG|nr:Alpha/Beta hydrolase protein [Blyttiomyces helicus]|eukprot:RKO91703.1 Alpha/Beta hydrolase protein [Blyttiomyces helicus]
MPICRYLASRGWVIVMINYRLAPHHPYPEALVDAKRALRWVKENVAAYGDDPGAVAVCGGSAGFESVDTSVIACVRYYPVVDMTNRSKYWRTNHLQNWFLTKICGRRGPFSEKDVAWLEENGSPVCLVDSQAAKPEGLPPFFVLG